MQTALPRMMTIMALALSTVTSLFFIGRAGKLAHEISVSEMIQQKEAAGEGKNGAGEHGAARGPAASPLMAFDEIFINVPGEAERSHTLGVKIEVELFEEDSRRTLEQWQGAVKDAVIGSAAEQNYARLSTVAGKLFFKEVVVARINQVFNKPLVRDVHFTSFYLQ